jgi:hypothetical protein
MSDDGTTCEPFRLVQTGESISSVGVSHARTSAAKDARPESWVCDPGSGPSSQESFVFFDRDSSSWKTSAILPIEGLDKFLEIWPSAGSMRNGKCYHRRRLVRHIAETGYSSWPTLLAGDADCLMRFSAETLQKMPSRQVTKKRNGGDKLCEVLAGEFDSYLDSNFGHWLMGFPLDWTDLDVSETPSCPRSPSSSDA